MKLGSATGVWESGRWRMATLTGDPTIHMEMSESCWIILHDITLATICQSLRHVHEAFRKVKGVAGIDETSDHFDLLASSENTPPASPFNHWVYL